MNDIQPVPEPTKVLDLIQTFVRSDHSLTQLHVALAVIHEAIETDTSLDELKTALYAAIKIRRA